MSNKVPRIDYKAGMKDYQAYFLSPTSSFNFPNLTPTSAIDALAMINKLEKKGVVFEVSYEKVDVYMYKVKIATYMISYHHATYKKNILLTSYTKNLSPTIYEKCTNANLKSDMLREYALMIHDLEQYCDIDRDFLIMQRDGWRETLGVPDVMNDWKLPLKVTIAKLAILGFEIINPETNTETFNTFDR